MDSLISIPRPAAWDYAPYYHPYVATLPPGDIIALLREQGEQTAALLDGFGEARADHRYAPGKWSVKEVAGHLADTERLFAFRALWFARGDRQPQPGMDENAWVAHGGFAGRTLASLIDELRDARRASLSLFRNLDARALARRGVANGREVTVAALPFLIAGHERHHARVLRERYR